MRVIWTPEAQAHLDGIYQYVKRDAPFYAEAVVDKLTRRSHRIFGGPVEPTIRAQHRDQAL